MNRPETGRRIGGHLADLTTTRFPQVTNESSPHLAVTDPHFWGHHPLGVTRRHRP